MMKKQNFLSKLLLFLLIPALIAAGVFSLDRTNYYLLSTLVIIVTLAAFFLHYESKEKRVRELVIIAVFTAVTVAGRSAFFLLPQVKPMLALTILAGIGLNPQAGFMVGAMSFFVSNIFFGQGPWTPWQMISLGICGLAAGIIFKKGRVPRHLPLICIYGGASAFLIFGGIVNLSFLFFFTSSINLKTVLSVYISAFRDDLTHSISTMFFLSFLTPPILWALEWINKKYDLFDA